MIFLVLTTHICVAFGSAPGTPQRAGSGFALKCVFESSAPASYVMSSRKSTSTKLQPTTSTRALCRADVIPFIVPRNSAGPEMAANVREVNNIRKSSSTISSKVNDFIKMGNGTNDSVRTERTSQSASILKPTICNDRFDGNLISRPDTPWSDSVVADDEIQ